MGLVRGLEAKRHGGGESEDNGHCLEWQLPQGSLLPSPQAVQTGMGMATTTRAGAMPSISKEDSSEFAELMSAVSSGVSLIPIPT